MKFNLILVGLFSVIAFGCSSKQTASETAAAASPTPAPTATPAPQAAAAAATGAVTCEKGADKRTIEVVAKGKGCEVHYTKGGKTETPAKSGNGMGHCEKTSSKIRGKLEGSGYKCS